MDIGEDSVDPTPSVVVERYDSESGKRDHSTPEFSDSLLPQNLF